MVTLIQISSLSIYRDYPNYYLTKIAYFVVLRLCVSCVKITAQHHFSCDNLYAYLYLYIAALYCLCTAVSDDDDHYYCQRHLSLAIHKLMHPLMTNEMHFNEVMCICMEF